MEKDFDKGKIFFRLHENGIIEYGYQDNIHITAEMINENFVDYWSFVDGHIGKEAKFLTLITVPKKVTISQAAMKLTSELYKPTEHRVIKLGYVCPSKVSKILVYILNRFKNPSYEYKIFTNRQKAEDWLLSN